MSITIHLFYTGAPGNARKFAEEMEAGGIADRIRQKDGNEGYEYYFPKRDPDTVLLIDRWRDAAALDAHHASPEMAEIAALRERYDLHMRVERFTEDQSEKVDETFLRR